MTEALQATSEPSCGGLCAFRTRIRRVVEPGTGSPPKTGWVRRGCHALEVAVTHVFLYPDDRSGLSEGTRDEYAASARKRGIALRLADPATTNPNQILVIRDGDFAAIDAPYFFGHARCGRPAWEHTLRETLEMDDPCFPTPLSPSR